MTVDDDNTLASKGPGHRLKGFFTIKAAVPPKVAEAVVVKSPEAAPPKEVKEEVEAKPAEPEPEPVVEDKAVYVDDNDGSKGGPCAACEGCTIL